MVKISKTKHVTKKGIVKRNPKTKYYHSTTEVLPKTFIVRNKASSTTKIKMQDDYGIDDFEGGLFVSDNNKFSKSFGNIIYSITSDKKPIMLDWGIYIYPNGTKVKASKITQ